MSRRPAQQRQRRATSSDATEAAESPTTQPPEGGRRQRGGRDGGDVAVESTGRWADAADQERGGLLVVDDAGEPFAVVPPTITTGLRRFVGRSVGGSDGELPRRIGVTATLAGEGVTFITRALGAVLAHDLRARVCIVETNWWRSRRGKDDRPTATERIGLADVLRGEAEIDQVLQPTSDPLLAFVTAGAPSVRERPVLARAPEFESALRTLSDQFDYVLLDLPPAGAVAETLTMVQHTEGYLLVIRHGVTTEGQVRATLEMLDSVPQLGVLLNRSNPRVPRRLLRALALR